ncbi:MAG: glycosyltransferase family 4 protein [Candidatus Doudnabacteria bacterium CG10_big_fil_rev_8_21_14_0_10_41_10]|uniref:Glycosyltransferase family 4 protein n=1 Tax=Candidatus Doudnabacteria bacterium CG10_big_fil_rev_8_21_14_0_10_41_10 TaxID=1974551 RepID=A0A2H0VD58_9BACT|nr:MAG: glycosyltransferase family 4 protein [Candidatus Doudnabacteria bacterium CG10_big_fil_rev_8_21_14_0_10_41_10]
MKVALVHDFLTQLGGAERVLDELHQMFPQAPVFTLVYDENKTQGKYTDWDIRTSFIQKLPWGIKRYKWYLALMPKAIESFDFSEYDLVLSDASAFAKGVKVKKPTKHICYCHTPTRYLWQMTDEYISTIQYPWFIKKIAKPFLMRQKLWDYKVAQKVDFFIANSLEVQSRIKKYYDRNSVVIYPPVDTNFFFPASDQLKANGYFLTAGRLEPYKKIDLVVKALKELDKNLVVAGSGSLENELMLESGKNIRFLGRVTDEKLRDLYRGAQAFIFPSLEDAGIMMLESLAMGTPVIAYGKGGALEFIKPGQHGELFYEQTKESLKTVLENFDPSKYNQEELVKQAERFSKQSFRSQMNSFIYKET